MEMKSIYDQAHAQIEHIFRVLLPEQGLSIREDQIQLCHEMLNSLFWGRVSLSDAGVGIGKTHAYLVACMLWRLHCPANQARTVVISTSSIALQTAIQREYIPFLSRVLSEAGILEHPVKAVILKGKERFICEARLAERQEQVLYKNRAGRQRAVLRSLERNCDLDEAQGLSAFDRRHVCVPPACPPDCSFRGICRYQEYLRDARGAETAIQICNHNYLLADAEHRRQGLRPLLKDYHVLVVDEAHKLPEAARQMYGESVSPDDLEKAARFLLREHDADAAAELLKMGAVLVQTFSGGDRLEEQAWEEFPLAEQCAGTLKRCAAGLHKLCERMASSAPRWLVRQLETAEKVLERFFTWDTRYVLYIRYDRMGRPVLCAGDRDIPTRLSLSLWDTGIVALLTSGTLATGRNFIRARQMLGLQERRCVDTFTAPSPFDYQNNCLLYLPSERSFPSKQLEMEYVANVVEELVTASYGHALILFTSYRMMGDVYARVKARLPFPIVGAWRNGQQAVRLFKSLPNAVLFAAGPCWEGMDFPGDCVSLLVIVRLPFRVPDPVSEAERKQYPALHGYIQTVVLPDMQRKLRQGFGRAIRTETDTCVVAVLDRRASMGNRYHDAVLDALPKCRMTDRIGEVESFFRDRKGPEYFGDGRDNG